MTKNKSLLYPILFAFIFTVVGELAPRVANRVADDTAFYEIKNARVIGANFEACDTVTIELEKRSKDNYSAFRLVALMKIEDDGVLKNISMDDLSKQVTLDKAPVFEKITVDYYLPCDITPGNYFFKSDYTFEIEDGIKKKESFETEVIRVVDTP